MKRSLPNISLPSISAKTLRRLFSRRVAISFAWVVGVVAAVSATCCEGALVRFRESATVAGAVVTLGDVAEVHDNDPQQAERLRSMTLVPAPAPGRRLRLDFATVRSRLLAHGFNLAELEFSGSSMTLVSTPEEQTAPVVTQPRLARAPASAIHDRKIETRLAEAIARYLERNDPQRRPVLVSVELIPGQAAQLAAADLTRLEIVNEHPLSGAPLPMELRVADANGQPQQIVVRCRAEFAPKVVVLKYDLPKGRVIRPEDVEWRQARERPAAAVLDHPDQVIGRETTRSLSAGQSLTADDVQNVPLIRTGDIVTVYSRKPGVVVRMEAKARSGGALGDQVILMTLDGREKLQARVTGFHQAEVVGSSSSQSTAPAAGIRLTPQAN